MKKPQTNKDYELVRYTDDGTHAVVQQGGNAPVLIPRAQWQRMTEGMSRNRQAHEEDQDWDEDDGTGVVV